MDQQESDATRSTELRPKPYYFCCPKCGNNMEFRRLQEDSGGLGCALLFFGGLIPAILYSFSKSSRVQCGKCHYIFGRPGLPSSRMANRGCAIIVWLLVIIMLPTLFASIFSGLDGANDPPVIVRIVADFLQNNSTISAWVVIGIILLAGLYGVGLWIIGAIRQRKKIAEEFRINPE